jgi:uncharacterized sulfatase
VKLAVDDRCVKLPRFLFIFVVAVPLVAASRPNLLWITSEDNGPHLGCYGDAYARTPNLDALAAKGTVYRNVWSTAPVCAPARTAIISGMYPNSTGAEHMRSEVRLPAGMKMYPQLLREAGYYCSNNSKEDYNLTKPGKVWDESSPRAHYRNRAAGQSFFAIFNLTTTHESQIRKRPHDPIHDPTRVRVPDYHPDRPEVRQDWAQYYDQLSIMDAQAGEILRELEQEGLGDDTIVFYFGDHGSGMPRSKRCTYNSGLRVPLIVYVPPTWKEYARAENAPWSDRLVGFVDLGPTVLSLAGLVPPANMQGGAFLGLRTDVPREFLYGVRGRMDERIDISRSVFDGRFVYLRNYHPHRPWGQHVAYMFETPTTRVWHELFEAGELTETQAAFWRPKAPEELYDLRTDPDEVRNLASDSSYGPILARLREANRAHLAAIRDVGFLPEGEIHSRSAGDAPFEMGQDEQRYPFRDVFEMAESAAGRDLELMPKLVDGLAHSDSAVRYWAALGILIRDQKGVSSALEVLRNALQDPSPHVRIVAAEALGKLGEAADLEPSLAVLMSCADAERHGTYVATAALNSIDALGERAAALKAAIGRLPRRDPQAVERVAEYPGRMIDTLMGRDR